MSMSNYECEECEFEDDEAETVAGHMLSEHGINVFHDLERLKDKSVTEKLLGIIEDNV